MLAEDGALHACGRGNFGQLGLNSREHRLQPARVGGTELPGGAPVVLVAAGGSHWAAVLEDGAVLTCGLSSGQLGHGNAQDRLQPARLGLPVFGGARVVLVACGGRHTLAVTGGGRVYSCGLNREGQLGHGNTTGTHTFTLVDAAHFEGASIVMAACRFEHSVAATAEGDVFTWGADMTRERPTLPAVEPTTGRRASVVRASSQAIRVIVDCIETPDCIEKRERGRSLPFPFPFYSLCLSFFLVLLCERRRKRGGRQGEC